MVKRAFRRVKPIYLMHQKSLLDLEKKAVIEGIYDIRRLIYRLTDVNIEFRDLGYWKKKDISKPYQSVDWYTNLGKQESTRKTQLNADIMLDALAREPSKDIFQGGTDHYDILVLTEDIYGGDNRFVIGGASRLIGAIISTYRFRHLDYKIRRECIKTETIHELGHVFGLPSAQRDNTKESLGKHCTNTCVMRQGLKVPDDWIEMTRDRINYGLFCGDCQEDLKNYFH
ncbi:MAG: hypothetical protein ACP5D2_01550 [Candidatus Nanoarchaeia archaeon]